MGTVWHLLGKRGLVKGLTESEHSMLCRSCRYDSAKDEKRILLMEMGGLLCGLHRWRQVQGWTLIGTHFWPHRKPGLRKDEIMG